jgi:plastocyanin
LLAAGQASAIDGEVDFTGTPPQPGKLHREADPFCARTQVLDPTVLVDGGKLVNVWVHVTRGAPDSPPPAGTVDIDQSDCMYQPRVTAAVVGQKIATANFDPTLHNVHVSVGGATLLNRGMPNEKAPAILTVASAEGVMRWRCDVHPWMRGYVGVSRNALQAVTDQSGNFHIENVPPGRYTIESWHEKLGAKSQEVTVDPGRRANVVFKYDGTEGGS